MSGVLDKGSLAGRLREGTRPGPDGEKKSSRARNSGSQARKDETPAYGKMGMIL